MSDASARGDGLVGTGYDLADLVSLRRASARLRLGGRQTAASWRPGSRVSRIRGRGMSFCESRPYDSGDDVRLIDWRVTARTGRPHTKVFEEEKERSVFVIAQFSASMYFGTRVAFKHVVAAELAALVGWAAVGGGDRIGALLAFAGGHAALRPSGGRRAVMRLLRTLESLGRMPSATASPALADTLRRAAQVVRPGSLVFVVGDFYDFDESASIHLAQLGRHNDIVVCQVLDRIEIAAPPPGEYPVSDGDAVASMVIGHRAADGWHRRLKARIEQPLTDFARRHRLLHGRIVAGAPVSGQVEAILARPPGVR